MNPKYVWQITFCPTVSLIISRLLSIFKAALENIYLLKKKSRRIFIFNNRWQGVDNMQIWRHFDISEPLFIFN